MPHSRLCDGVSDLAFADLRGLNHFKMCGMTGAYNTVKYFLDEAFCVKQEDFEVVTNLMLGFNVMAVLTVLLGARYNFNFKKF